DHLVASTHADVGAAQRVDHPQLPAGGGQHLLLVGGRFSEPDDAAWGLAKWTVHGLFKGKPGEAYPGACQAPVANAKKGGSSRAVRSSGGRAWMRPGPWQQAQGGQPLAGGGDGVDPGGSGRSRWRGSAGAGRRGRKMRNTMIFPRDGGWRSVLVPGVHGQ